MRREWTDREVKYLNNRYLKQSVETTAKRLVQKHLQNAFIRI